MRIAIVHLLPLSVILCVCQQHNSHTNYPKVYKLGIGSDLAVRFRG